MEQRKGIGKKIRFEVFKRDSFTCQYCGRMAPDVILEVDHINPIAEGGNNEIINLITSCRDCNRGKGKKKLSDNAEIKKQQKQLEELALKREQLKMMIEWKQELSKIDDFQVEQIGNLFENETGYSLSDYSLKKIRKEIKSYGFQSVYEATEISINQYFEGNKESANYTVEYIYRILRNKHSDKDDKLLYEINYLCKIASNRNINCVYKLRKFLHDHYERSDFENVKSIFISKRNYTAIMGTLCHYYGVYD